MRARVALVVVALLLWGCMADYVTSSDLGEIEAIQAADDADAGLPRAGVHVGRGPHVEMDPEDPSSPGWTCHTCDILEHPKLSEWAYQIRDDLEERLTGTVPQSMIDQLQTRAPLSCDWFGYALPEQIADTLGSPDTQYRLVTLGDSRFDGSQSEILTYMSSWAWCGLQHGALAVHNTGAHTVVRSAHSANVPPTNTLLGVAPTWFPKFDSAVKFSGANEASNTINCRLTSETDSEANYPLLWAAFDAADSVTIRSWAYGLEANADTPIAVWVRADNAIDENSGNPRSTPVEFSELGAGGYQEFGVSASGIDWVGDADRAVSVTTVALKSAATVDGAQLSIMGPEIAADGAGLVYHNWAIGGSAIDTHFLDGTVFPAALLTDFAPMLGAIIWHLDLGANNPSNNTEAQHLAFMRQLIELCRASCAGNNVVLTSSYAGANDNNPGATQYYHGAACTLAQDPGVLFLDTRAAMPDYATSVALGYYSPTSTPGDPGDHVHYKALGKQALFTWLSDARTAAAANGPHWAPISTDLTTNPWQVGVATSISGRAKPGDSVAVTVNGDSAGSATADGSGDWTVSFTPTVAMRGAGSDIDVVATPAGVSTFASTRPTTIAAA